MAASLDDVLRAIEAGNDILDDLRTNGMGGGGGGAGGKGEGGKGRSGLGGALAMLKKGPLGAIGENISMAASAVDSLGISAGLRASNLGASREEGVLRGKRSLLENMGSLPFANSLMANTNQELAVQKDATSGVTKLTDAYAMAGGTAADLSEGGIDEIAKRELELNREKYSMREMVANRIAVVGDNDLNAAMGKDAGNLADLVAPIKDLSLHMTLLSNALRQAQNNLTGTR